MRVVIDNQVRVENPHDELRIWCKNHLVLTNPDYAKKARMNKWTGNTPKTLSLYSTDGDALILPYGCLRTVMLYMNGRDSAEIVMPSPVPVWYDCDIPLYDYQKEAVAKALEAQYGILQSPAGSGKTQMGLAMAVTLGRKTLWLTHTHDLLMQSKERAERYMRKSLLGTITEGQVNMGLGITFATVQTMCNLDLVQYKNAWDCIIVDECHRVAGTPTAMTQFSKVLNSLAARHKYGLSATVHRADGMIAATYALLGDVVYAVPEEAVADKIMRVSVLPRLTDVDIDRAFLDTDGTIVYAKLLSYLGENIMRNNQIVGDLVENRDHYNLILSDRLNHLEDMMWCLPEDLRRQAVMVSGKMTSRTAKAERNRAIEQMRRGEKRYLFATYSLAKEGLDIPRLDRLYLTTPQKDYAVVAQSVGRVARAFEGKGEPVVYDYVDGKIQYLARTYKKRCTTYRKLNCKFLTEGDKT